MPSTSSSGRINNTPAGGAAYLAALLKEERAKSRAAGATPITVAAGDLIGASPLLSAAFHDEPTIEAMNKMGLQVASVGNHEFDEGWRELKRMQNGGCLDDGDGVNGADSCPGGKTSRVPTSATSAPTWSGRTRRPQAPTVFPATKVMKVEGEKVAFIGMTLEATDTIVSAGRHRRRSTSPTRSRPPTPWCPGSRSGASSRSSCCCTRACSPPTPTAYNDCTGVTGPALAIAQNLKPAIDAVVSGHTHQPYNCVVKDPNGNPRLLTSASSLGRMVSKLHFLIDPESGDIVRPAAFAENMIVENSEGRADRRRASST